MRRLGLGLVGVLAGGLALSAQQLAPPVFRAGVTLVRVDVTVIDKDSNQISNLTADDFEVKLDGHVRPVRALDYEHVAPPATGAIQPASTGRPAREVSNATPVAEPRLFVMMLDDLSIAPSRGKGMFFAATRFVDALPATDIVGFTTSSGSSALNPTHNRAAVDAALRHTAGEFIDPRDSPPDVPVGVTDALQIVSGDQVLLKQVIIDICPGLRTASDAKIANDHCAEDVGRKVRSIGAISRGTAARQLQAYLDVIRAMKAAPGLKELVVISDGVGVAHREQLELFQPVARAAADAGVQLSVLAQDPDLIDLSQGGASSSSSDGGPRAIGGAARYSDNRALDMNLMTLTDMAGGTFYRVMGQPDRFFEAVARATSGVYHLGVEVPSGSMPKAGFSVSARVKRSGVTAHANRVALLPAPAVAVPVDEQLRSAVTKGLANYGVPVAIGTAVRRGMTPSGLDLGVNVEVPAPTPGPLSVMYGLLDPSGNVQVGRQTVASPADGGTYRISMSLPVAPGGYRLRFAVADADGRVGSIDAPVRATLTAVGPLVVSDILTTWSGTDNTPRFLALEEVPSTATTLRAFLELYAGSSAGLPGDVQVTWRVVGSGAPAQVVVPARAVDRLTAVAQFSLEGLAVGTYELQATVSVAGAPVGTVSTTFRKAAKESLPSRLSWFASAVAR